MVNDVSFQLYTPIFFKCLEKVFETPFQGGEFRDSFEYILWLTYIFHCNYILFLVVNYNLLIKLQLLNNTFDSSAISIYQRTEGGMYEKFVAATRMPRTT